MPLSKINAVVTNRTKPRIQGHFHQEILWCFSLMVTLTSISFSGNFVCFAIFILLAHMSPRGQNSHDDSCQSATSGCFALPFLYSLRRVPTPVACHMQPGTLIKHVNGVWHFVQPLTLPFPLVVTPPSRQNELRTEKTTAIGTTKVTCCASGLSSAYSTIFSTRSFPWNILVFTTVWEED